MKKVLLVLLLFGMIFGGVYGEFNFEIDGDTVSIIDGGSITYITSANNAATYTYDQSEDIFCVSPDACSITKDNFLNTINNFDNNGKIVVYEGRKDSIAQTYDNYNSKVILKASTNSDISSNGALTFLESNAVREIGDSTIKLDYEGDNSEIVVKNSKSQYLVIDAKTLTQDFSNGNINNKYPFSDYDIEIKKGASDNSYININLGDKNLQIIGIDQDTALRISMESPSVKTIPSHLQSTLNEYTSSIENLARLKETDEQLYNAIINNGDAQTVNQINNAQKSCSGSSCINSLETLSNLKKNGFDVDSTHYTPHYDAYDSARDAYNQEKATLANCDTQECRESSSEKLKEKEEELNKQALLMEKYMDSGSAYEYVLNKCQSSNDAEKCQSMITAFSDGASCQNSWFPTSLCTFFSDERLVEQSVAQEMENFKKTITDECKSQSSQKFEDCYNDAYDKKLETSKRNFEETAWYCPESKTFCSDDDLIKCSSATECKDKEGLTCKSDDYACKLLEEELEEKQRYTDKEKYVETSTAFDVIAALMNPDQNALLASELFGFESDFSDLPQWLTEDTASLICLAKIDGYLDTQVESQFKDSAGNSGARGITQYGCSLEDGLEFDPNTRTYQPTAGLPCVEVLADLRAERTPLLPTGEVQITYSYYLKSPLNVNISYMLYAGYYLENQSDLELQPLFLHRNSSLDIRVLEAGEDISDFRVARIPGNGTLVTPIGDESIKLLLQAFYTDGSSIDEYVSIISPAYPIEVGSYRDPLGQQSSSSSGGESTLGENTGTQEDEQSEGLDDDDIRNNACQLMGTC
ncbi:MAG: hypothetical protein VXZ40_00010 [Nanoarchaeota archaeon]|nr:hypothetical protein [Nanoarchaeota archaeon]